MCYLAMYVAHQIILQGVIVRARVHAGTTTERKISLFGTCMYTLYDEIWSGEIRFNFVSKAFWHWARRIVAGIYLLHRNPSRT